MSLFGDNLAESFTGRATTGSNDFMRDIFYDMRIDGNHGSTQHLMEKEGRVIDGYYETVQFLADVRKLRIIHYHAYQKKEANEDTRDKPNWLCNKTFDPNNFCPACAHRQKWTKAGRDGYKQALCTGIQSTLLVPTYVLGQNTKPTVKNGKRWNPIQWLGIHCHVRKYKDQAGNWAEDKGYFENYQRLMEQAQRFPTDLHYYMVFQKTRGEGEKKQFTFAPVQKNDTNLSAYMQFQHPLVQDWMEGNRFVYDSDYYDLLTAFTLMRFAAWVDPDTGETYEYGGLYQKANALYEQYAGEYPPAAVALNVENYDAAPTLPTL